jgi:hypothetical protein
MFSPCENEASCCYRSYSFQDTQSFQYNIHSCPTQIFTQARMSLPRLKNMIPNITRTFNVSSTRGLSRFDVTKMIKQQTVDEALHLYNTLPTHKINPDPYIMSALIRLLQKTRNTAAGLFLVTEVQKYDINDSFVLNSLLQISIQHDNLELVTTLFNRMVCHKLVCFLKTNVTRI